jgi:hypothetical protein
MERLQKCVQVDSEYVGWAKRTQYIEIDFNCEIRLCSTWRGTPYISICKFSRWRSWIEIGLFHSMLYQNRPFLSI